jgi:hypothetical protein
MERNKPKLLLLFVVLLLFCTAGAAFGDWDVGDPNKMHYPQLPKQGGWDVAVFSGGSIYLADDWQCSQTGPVSDIHFWVSWEANDVEQISGFAIRIWSDDPCGPQGWSEPNELLWQQDFYAGDFTVRDMNDDLQGWFDPYHDEWTQSDHTKWAQVNVTDINNPFIQQEGKIYWLMIDMGGPGNIGWKESGSPHFRDDAVYSDGLNWYELRDPLTGESLDLAFVITGEEEEPNETVIKYIQEPDLTENGMDIRIDRCDGTPRIMADDFLCNTTGLITDVHLWGSWKYDDKGEMLKIHLSIHSDDPVGPGGSDPDNTYSMPDELLWEKDFSQGEFAEYLYYELPVEEYEWWWDIQNIILFSTGDTEVWKYDLYIDPCEAFLQQGDPCHPVIYWLDVYVETDGGPGETDGGKFGWKTRQWPEHFADDAVYASNFSPPYSWSELRYPVGVQHPYEGDSIDMAFAITTGQAPNVPSGKPLTAHTKWSQPPVEISPNSGEPRYCGWDEMSWQHYPPPPHSIWQIVADDFRCLGNMPITSIHWWGSHVDWDGNEPPASPPCTEEWRIRFWSNAAADSNVPYSRPEEILREIKISEQRVQVEKAGIDESPRSQDYRDTCFQYNVDLEPNEVFWQGDFNDLTEDNIFWISIEALDFNSVNPHHWGWKTRPWHWMDDAVTMFVDSNATLGTVVDPCANQITPIKYMGESFDVSFELDTDPNYIKWEQLYTGIRNWSHYEDEPSTATTNVILKKWEQLPDPCWSGLHCHDWESDGYYYWITLADDWRCDGGDVTDIHWWGNYEDRGSGVDYFHLSIHEPNVMNPCLPGLEVWGADVPFSSLTEVDTGMVQNTGDTVYFYEYNLDIPFAQVEDQNYWLDITAYSVDPCNPALWHWQENARHFTPILCPAVSGGGPDKDWVPLDWPSYGYSDMAFVITSTQEANEPNGYFVADDWRCLKRTPVTAVVWWGSYIGYGYEAGSTGPFMPLPVSPDRFELTMWTDVPDPNLNNPNTFSHPGHMIWLFDANEYDEVLVGYDKYPKGEPNEPVFRYSVRLPEEDWFHQPDYNEVFWLSVQAIYNQNTANYTWGWTNHQHVFNDDAVSGRYDDTNEVWLWEELKDQTGASEDMSFMLFTDPNECSTCANYNLDAIINFFDFAEFANEWYWSGPAGGYNNGDLDCDGDVDLNDLDIFCQQWLKCCP